jgi:N-acetyl-gamma-glutamyl-phosphate reductase
MHQKGVQKRKMNIYTYKRGFGGQFMITVGVIGATGYAGSELVRLLINHPNVGKILVGSKSYAGEKYSDIYPNFNKKLEEVCLDADLSSMSEKCDVLFLSLPHGISSHQVTQKMVDECVIIDLGADFRFKNLATYESWYKTKHGNPSLNEQAVYGLCEINRQSIKNSRLIANPGCYTTTSILAAYPLVAENLIENNSLIIDAISGVSGAGRGQKLTSLYCEVNESLKPYGVTNHRHTPEIEEQLGLAINKEPITISFTPHLVPMNRGILASLYATVKEGVDLKQIEDAYNKHYKDEQFIRLLKQGQLPETRYVKGSNFTDLSFTIDERSRRFIGFGALDNLVKGAAGQAVQNMNIVFGYEEALALETVSPFPI